MQLAVFHGKHADEYYPVRNEEDWYRICMDVFNQRDVGSYFWEPGDKPEEPESPGEDAPDWAMDEYNKKVRSYESKLRSWQREAHDWELVQKARDGDLEAARSVIENRQDGEYEGYTIEYLSEPGDSAPYWKVPEKEQSIVYESQVRKIINEPEADDLYEEAEDILKRGTETQSEKPENYPRDGEYSNRTDRYLLYLKLDHLVRAKKEGKINDDRRGALESAKRIIERMDQKRKG